MSVQQLILTKLSEDGTIKDTAALKLGGIKIDSFTVLGALNSLLGKNVFSCLIL